mmetsp:Transcript_25344/g.54784  ORF Transcript_25344/g.54784 Transcript_25344/m.54784 type:complete len:327 (-) Transcript_25344:25-1005(-)
MEALERFQRLRLERERQLSTLRSTPRTCGVWSPFGQDFAPLGEIKLHLGRKPLEHAVESTVKAHANDPPVLNELQPEVNAPAANDNSLEPIGTQADVLPLPPPASAISQIRFPRRQLISSERRLRATIAGGFYLTKSASMGVLTSSPAVPSSAFLTDGVEEQPARRRMQPVQRYQSEFWDVQQAARDRLERRLQERRHLRDSLLHNPDLHTGQQQLSSIVLKRHQLERPGGAVTGMQAGLRTSPQKGRGMSEGLPTPDVSLWHEVNKSSRCRAHASQQLPEEQIPVTPARAAMEQLSETLFADGWTPDQWECPAFEPVESVHRDRR